MVVCVDFSFLFSFSVLHSWLLISRVRTLDFQNSSQTILSPGLKISKTEVKLLISIEYNFWRKEISIFYFLLFLNSVCPWAGRCWPGELVLKFFFLLVFIYMGEDVTMGKKTFLFHFFFREKDQCEKH